ncbi:MAG: GNAT family N-acetyltransferase [Bacteroidales bacterium]|nr:GNAT family N-acetyltransferase [Bacteroidales bacterium]
MQVRSLSQVAFDRLYEAFSEAFKDYEISITRYELQKMHIRRGFEAKLSFGAFDNDRLVSFTFNGIGWHNGQYTAYDTGTGTIDEYKGQGLASRVFTESIPYLVEDGITQYLLEVLQHNDKAISVYKKLGFEVSREFNYFVNDAEMLAIIKKDLGKDYTIKQITVDDLGEVTMFWDFAPSWQNSFASIFRSQTDFIVLGAYREKDLVGYGIFEPTTGDITQLAVHKLHRRKGIGTALLKEMVKRNKHSNIKAINTEIGCENITRFFLANGLPLKGKQYEMINRMTLNR